MYKEQLKNATILYILNQFILLAFTSFGDVLTNLITSGVEGTTVLIHFQYVKLSIMQSF